MIAELWKVWGEAVMPRSPSLQSVDKDGHAYSENVWCLVAVWS